MKTQTLIIILVLLVGLAAVFFVFSRDAESPDMEEPNTEAPLDGPTEEDALPTEPLPEDRGGEVSEETAGTESTEIVFDGSSYTPSQVSVPVGSTVTWINQSDMDMWPASNVHPTHEIYSEFDPKAPVGPGESWSFTFDRSGTWQFHDHLQPSLRGTVTVE